MAISLDLSLLRDNNVLLLHWGHNVYHMRDIQIVFNHFAYSYLLIESIFIPVITTCDTKD